MSGILYTTCIVQGFFLNGAIPLYFELAMESTYPITETMTSGIMNLTYNIIPLFFVLVFLIPNVGEFSSKLLVYPVQMVLFCDEFSGQVLLCSVQMVLFCDAIHTSFTALNFSHSGLFYKVTCNEFCFHISKYVLSV